MNVFLSQCMIVKNEEANIRRALSWAKDIAFEQIVVDTGSTDRTVEIAKEMGARVLSFSWINDFSAAKNYAISQARGNWIAFLDADEYMKKEDAKKLYQLLERIENTKGLGNQVHVVRQSLMNLNSERNVFSVMAQDRIFRNLPWIRYRNRIHEVLSSRSPEQELTVLKADITMPIYHTGYTREAYARTNKAGRNLELLEREVREQPDNPQLWRYMGDSQSAAGQREEAIDSWKKCLALGKEKDGFDGARIHSAGSLMRLLIRLKRDAEAEEIYHQTRDLETGRADLEYFMGDLCLRRGRYTEGCRHLEASLQALEQDQDSAVFYSASLVTETYGRLVRASVQAGEQQQAVRYAVLTLRDRKRQKNILTLLLHLFLENGEGAEAVEGFLGRLYDFTREADVLFVLRSAKLAGFDELASRLRERLPEETLQELKDRNGDDLWAQADLLPGWFEPSNREDLRFLTHARFLTEHTREELLEEMKGALKKLRADNEQNFRNYQELFRQLPFWGALDDEAGVYEVLERRSRFLSGAAQRLADLYGRLGDYRSRRTLNALLDNWIRLEHRTAAAVREFSPQWFDPDLIPEGKGKVLADVGAHRGETVRSFVNQYGEGYRSIYCYECDPGSRKILQQRLADLDRIVISTCGVGAKKEIRTLSRCEAGDLYTRLLPQTETEGSADGPEAEAGQEVQVVALDEDIQEDIDILKINVCGMEREVLLGAQEHIRRSRPVITAAAFWSCEQLTELAEEITRICPDYVFYLRHYGADLFMANYVLYAVCEKEGKQNNMQ